MPSYPDSVWAPSAKSAGQTITAAFFNDPQDEIVAIEGGIRNGTAPLNSSGSTFVTVNVTGGSTLASLDVNGNSTLASSITVGSLPHIFPSSGGVVGEALTVISTSGSTMTLEWRPRTVVPPDAANLGSTDVELTNNSTLGIPWTHQFYLTNSSMHSTGTNPSRVSPQSTGLYQIACGLVLGGSGWTSTSDMRVRLLDSSAGVIADGPISGAIQYGVRGHAIGFKRFDIISAAPWVRAEVVVRDGSTHSVSTASFFEMHKM